MGRLRTKGLSTLATLAFALGGCMVGPDYQRPEAVPAPLAFKELQDWVPAQPADAVDKGAWWSVYNDPELDRLERMVEVSNQTLKADEAAYRNAVAIVAEARASLFPTVGIAPGVTRSGTGKTAPTTQFSLDGTTSWVPDLWGSVRRTIEGDVANAQASAADLANARLSVQATLAADYFDLRAEDSLARLLRETVAAYQRSLDIAQNQYKAGTTSSADYVTALATLQSAQAQLVGVAAQRQVYEHAIAVLTGHAPADITIPPGSLTSNVPVVPPGLPSELLERRPDVAASERTIQAANAQIGVQTAAYYPNVDLSAVTGFASPVSAFFGAGSRIWSLAASGSETLFSGGFRGAAVSAARAAYEQAVANYRQTVLTAFQQVEDALVQLRVYEAQAAAEDIAVKSTRKAVEVTLNAYKAGTVAYTSVVTEQTLLLSDQQSLLAIQQTRLVASVALIQALGGGWAPGDLPTTDAVKDGFKPPPP
jgi:NodT family efflux transporter outer membrane factor (OMF) lipoprotein